MSKAIVKATTSFLKTTLGIKHPADPGTHVTAARALIHPLTGAVAAYVDKFGAFVLPSCTTAQLPAVTLATLGSKFFVSDCTGGAQECTFNGTHWVKTQDGTTVV